MATLADIQREKMLAQIITERDAIIESLAEDNNKLREENNNLKTELNELRIEVGTLRVKINENESAKTKANVVPVPNVRERQAAGNDVAQ